MPRPQTRPPLAELAVRLHAAIVDTASGLADDAAELVERIGSGRFLLTVVGEFNRGKSTLVNALLARDVLPTGVVPVTTVTTTIAHGPDGLVVHHAEGGRRQGSLDELDELVTEAGNPGNRAGIDRVEVSVPADLLAPGVTIIDTPGFASRHAHNSATAAEALARTDAAILVLSAVQPVSERDLGLLDQLREVSVRTLIAVNRIDDVQDTDRDQVTRFVAAALREHGHDPDRLYPISAAQALAARRDGGTLDRGFADLLDEIDRIVTGELERLRSRAAERHLRALADRFANTLDIEQAAAAMTAADLDQRLGTFDRVVAEQHRRLDEDRAVLDRATTDIADTIYQHLLKRASDPPGDALDQLRRAADEIALGDLDRDLDRLLEDLVRQRVEHLREQVADQVSERWRDAAGRFLHHVTDRTDELADAARDLFTVDVRPPQPPTFSEQSSGFYYHLTPSATLTGGPAATLRRLLPAAVQRDRAARRATARYRDELVKHAGRIRWDVLQRLNAARNRLVATTREHLGRLADDIQQAARRATHRRDELRDQQGQWQARAERSRAVIHEIRTGTRADEHIRVTDPSAPGSRASESTT